MITIAIRSRIKRPAIPISGSSNWQILCENSAIYPRKKRLISVASPIFRLSNTRAKVRSNRLTITYSVPNRIGIAASSPLIRDWNGSTPNDACLNIPTLIPHIITPSALIRIRLAFIICLSFSPSGFSIPK